jgi:hypothetical protein
VTARAAGVFTLGMVLVGCGYTTTHHVLTGPAAPPRSGDVTVVLDGSPEPTDVDEVAIVQAVGNGSDADLEHVVAGLKKEARALGCDVVMRVHVDQGVSTASASGVAARSRADGSRQ